MDFKHSGKAVTTVVRFIAARLQAAKRKQLQPSSRDRLEACLGESWGPFCPVFSISSVGCSFPVSKGQGLWKFRDGIYFISEKTLPFQAGIWLVLSKGRKQFFQGVLLQIVPMPEPLSIYYTVVFPNWNVDKRTKQLSFFGLGSFIIIWGTYNRTVDLRQFK